MPSIVTHYVMSENVLNNLNNSKLKQMILDHYQLFAIGSNGPDLFFYYNVYPWLDQKKAKEVAKIGGQLHSQNINKFFEAVLETIQQNQDPKMIAYLAGQLCHWALDMVCHPYIFYYSQTHDQYSDYHHRNMESNLDSMVLKYIKHKDIEDFPIHHIVAFDQDDLHTIYHFYNDALKDVYNIEVDQDMIDNCMHMFYSLQKHLYDKTGWKTKVSQSFERLTNIKSQPLSMIVPSDYVDDKDLFNLNHNAWKHPVSGEISHQSFLELFDEGKSVAKQLLDRLSLFLEGECSIDSILDIIGNKTYDTGMQPNQQMQFFAIDEGKSKNEQ